MSIVQRALDQEELSDASIEELYTALGDKDTAKLYAKPYAIDFDHDIPTGAGNSVDRKTKYVDRVLYQACMDGAFAKTGLNPQQIIDRWLDHEHTEKCVVDGDNPVDNYYPAHTRALRKEHEGVLAILGTKDKARKIKTYEETIWPALLRCYHRPITRPPKDLWCAPLLDDATERDQEILAQLKSFGVYDADKRTKHDLHYQPGPRNCEDCRFWHPQFISQEHGELASCKIVNGLVRSDRHCDHFMPRIK